jgi:hypothetical protein
VQWGIVGERVTRGRLSDLEDAPGDLGFLGFQPELEQLFRVRAFHGCGLRAAC